MLEDDDVVVDDDNPTPADVDNDEIDNEKPEDPAPSDNDDDDPKDPSDDDNPDDDPKPTNRKNKVQKRIDKLTRKNYELAAENKRLQEQINGDQKPSPAAKDDKELKLEDFDSVEEFQAALIDYRVNQKVDETLSNKQRELTEAEQREEERKLVEAWDDKKDLARDRYDDFDDIVDNEDVLLTPHMGRAILEADLGADVMYFLGNNPEEAERIAELTPARQAIEIGKLEAKVAASLKKPKEKKPSKASEPIKPVGNKSDSVKDEDKMPIDEWMEKERKRLYGG